MGLEMGWWMCCTKRKGKRWGGWGDGELGGGLYVECGGRDPYDLERLA